MTPGTPTVTVLMSVYNGAQFLAEAVESVLVQEFTDFEFLIINDASTDASRSILSEFERRDSRVRVIDNPENVGLTRSLNTGINIARGGLIARLDADDLALPGRLEKQVCHLQHHPACTVVGSVTRLINSSGQPTGQTEYFSAAQLTAQFLFFNSVTHSSVMFRRESIIALGGYNEQFVRAQDYDLWIRCLIGGQQIELLPDVLTAHRVHQGQVTTTQTETMEQCRRLIVQSAWRGILGAELSDEFLTQQHQLLMNQPATELTSVNKFCLQLRSIRQAFSRRFNDNADGIAHFDQLIQRMTREACRLHCIPSDLLEKYVCGMSSAAFQIQTKLRSFWHCLSRLRFHCGKWRRDVLGQ